MNDPRILEPIPTPPEQRWREFRLLYLPRAAFVLGVIVAAWLWSDAIAPATLVAEADIQQADVRSAHAGVITSLNVAQFETVHAGQVVGQVMPLSAPLPGPAATPPTKLGNAAAAAVAPAPAAFPLIAPIDGVVSVLLRHPGETVAAGETVLRITSRKATRLTGYLRQPLPFEPEVGMSAEIRTRGAPRQAAMTKVTGVGGAMEAIPSSLLAAMRLSDKSGPEHALRILFAMPPGLALRPGEHVDVIIH
jgi:multidrug resistance efflux pump